MRQIVARRIMKLALFSFLLCGAGGVMAQSPHYLKADASLDSDFCYNVALKEAGLGTVPTVNYSLSATACFVVACATKNGNIVQGQPKSGSGTATTVVPLPVRNGQTTGIVQLCPGSFSLPNPGCTGNQEQVILAASYSNVSLSDNLGTPSPTLPNLSGSLPGFSGTCQ